MIETKREFWSMYELKLAGAVTRKPDEYWLAPNEQPSAYAYKVRVKFEAIGRLSSINLDSPSFHAMAKPLGIKFSQGRLRAAFNALKDE